MSKAKPIVRWAGGKTRLLKYLLPLVPESKCFVEVFGGGAALLLAKEKRAVEVWNDTHGDLCNLFRQAKYHPEALCQELEWMLGSRKDFYEYIEQPGLTEIQKAARWFFRNRVSFGGKNRSFGTGTSGGGASLSSKENWLAKIRAFSKRFDMVVIESLDWRKCLRVYDRPHTFFFFDPPYLNSGKTTYDAWSPEQMQELRTAIDGIKGQFLLTTCDSPECREIFKGLKIQGVSRKNGIENRGTQKKQYKELIITKK